ncbi:jg13789 [Pararge aegeria aegeria]|uniref:Jg13789 protein n=1 Tax=Pararge aegeria aegeria TaxID=348720 RepID=A0A8S4SEV1_9NEOP|nr:jg13789 [Pararge aegeria aegeria]
MTSTEIETDIHNKESIKISIDASSNETSGNEIKMVEERSDKTEPKLTNFKSDNTIDLLGVPRNGHRMSFMEEESVKERMRLSLLKQCSAILKQGDQRYSKETLHRTFQDEVRTESFSTII